MSLRRCAAKLFLSHTHTLTLSLCVCLCGLCVLRFMTHSEKTNQSSADGARATQSALRFESFNVEQPCDGTPPLCTVVSSSPACLPACVCLCVCVYCPSLLSHLPSLSCCRARSTPFFLVYRSLPPHCYFSHVIASLLSSLQRFFPSLLPY